MGRGGVERQALKGRKEDLTTNRKGYPPRGGLPPKSKEECKEEKVYIGTEGERVRMRKKREREGWRGGGGDGGWPQLGFCAIQISTA